MRVRMTRTERGSPDGMAVNTYLAGQEYAVPSDLGAAFIGMGCAVEATLPPVETPKGEAASVAAKPESAPGGVTPPPIASDATEAKIDAPAPKRRRGQRP